MTCLSKKRDTSRKKYDKYIDKVKVNERVFDKEKTIDNLHFNSNSHKKLTIFEQKSFSRKEIFREYTLRKEKMTKYLNPLTPVNPLIHLNSKNLIKKSK